MGVSFMGLSVTALSANAASTFPAAPSTSSTGSAATFECAGADKVFDAGRLDEATAKYSALGPSVPCAVTGLAVIREVQRLCALGQSYRAHHRDSDADAAYKAAISKAPNAACATKGVDATRQSWLTRWPSDAISGLQVLAELVGLALVLLFIFLLPAKLRRVRHLYLRFPVVRSLIRPQLSVSAFDDSALGDKNWGASLVARIQEELHRVHREALCVE
jgi:hypothetical protein